jgi:DNA-binding response OmpR family regulator
MVLIVDDELELVGLIERVLKRSGHEVSHASSGAEAVQCIGQQDYDLIMLDVKMPGVSGQDVYKIIREDRPHLAQRVIFTTGDAVSTQTSQWLKNTGCKVLEKPFDIRRLVSLVEWVLKQRPA